VAVASAGLYANHLHLTPDNLASTSPLNFFTGQTLFLVPNHSAKTLKVTGCGKYKHVMPVLRDVLHWLPMPQQIQFKIAFLVFNCIRGAGPAYFQYV